MLPTDQRSNADGRFHSLLRRQVTGSSLLLMGKMAAIALNLVTQLILARYLTSSAFGAFAYAISIVTACDAFATFGLRTALARFVPMFQEKRDYGGIIGTLIVCLGSVLAAGCILTFPFLLFLDEIGRMLAAEPQELFLLSIVILVIPITAMESILLNFFASFGQAKTIVVRRFLVGPILKFAAFAGVAALDAGVRSLAYGYLAVNLLGLMISAYFSYRLLVSENILSQVHWRTIHLPVAKLYGSSLPALSSEAIPIVMNSLGVIVVGIFYSAAEVALYAAVVPLSRLNRLIMGSMTPLYTPSAARLFVRKETGRLLDFYWQTTFWMSVLTFPCFALTFGLAQPLTEQLYGLRYAQSGPILALLAGAVFFNVLLGCNSHTLLVMGRRKAILLIDLSALAVNLISLTLLTRELGAFGAAIAAVVSSVFHNFLRQIGLRAGLGRPVMDRQVIGFYAATAVSCVALVGVHHLAPLSLPLALALAVTVCIGYFLAVRRFLQIDQAFPELRRIPGLQLLFT